MATTQTCYLCKHRKAVPWNSHIQCMNPDPDMTGDAYGIAMGWFFYPFLYDPTWMTRECANFEIKEEELDALNV